MKEMNSLKNDFAKYLATADASLLQTNNLLQQMDKSQKVAKDTGPLGNTSQSSAFDRRWCNRQTYWLLIWVYLF